MKSTRRSFLKGVGAGVLFLSLGHMGFSMKEAHAYARSLKIEGCKEYISVCPFCAVCCQIVAYVKNGKLQAYEYLDDLAAQCCIGPCLKFEDTGEKKHM